MFVRLLSAGRRYHDQCVVFGDLQRGGPGLTASRHSAQEHHDPRSSRLRNDGGRSAERTGAHDLWTTVAASSSSSSAATSRIASVIESENDRHIRFHSTYYIPL